MILFFGQHRAGIVRQVATIYSKGDFKLGYILFEAAYPVSHLDRYFLSLITTNRSSRVTPCAEVTQGGRFNPRARPTLGDGGGDEIEGETASLAFGLIMLHLLCCPALNLDGRHIPCQKAR